MKPDPPGSYIKKMFDKQQRKLKRSAKLFAVLSKYGFQDLLSRINSGKTNEASDNDTMNADQGLYQRIRLALEELGPTFVKLGQSFSNREDLLPANLITELQKLQDKVETIPMDVESVLMTEFDINPSDYFLSIEKIPIATASIAQVYTAVLLDGERVILKIKKPGILAVIEDDLLLVKDLVRLINSYSDFGARLNLDQAVSTFEKSLLEEVSLVNEKNNIYQFGLNFKHNRDTAVPKVYDQFSNNNVLCMGYIDGIKITDTAKLTENGLDPIKISEKGLRLFASQILDYGFFHADPHAGNILVTYDGKIVFIDFGAVGKIQPNDKDILENLIVAFVAKNPQKIIRNLKRMAVSYDIPDEKKFENDVAEVLDFVHNTSLKNIDPQQIINKMKDVLSNNHLFMPGYFYLLFKGIGLIEGVGRTINPDLDIVKTLAPYTRKIIAKKFAPQTIFKNSLNKVLDFTDNVEDIPKELRSLLEKLDSNKFTVTSEIRDIDKTNHILKSSFTNLILALIISANIIAMAILLSSDGQHFSAGSIILGIFTTVLAIILIFRIIKK